MMLPNDSTSINSTPHINAAIRAVNDGMTKAMGPPENARMVREATPFWQKCYNSDGCPLLRGIFDRSEKIPRCRKMPVFARNLDNGGRQCVVMHVACGMRCCPICRLNIDREWMAHLAGVFGKCATLHYAVIPHNRVLCDGRNARGDEVEVVAGKCRDTFDRMRKRAAGLKTPDGERGQYAAFLLSGGSGGQGLALVISNVPLPPEQGPDGAILFRAITPEDAAEMAAAVLPDKLDVRRKPVLTTAGWRKPRAELSDSRYKIVAVGRKAVANVEKSLADVGARAVFSADRRDRSVKLWRLPACMDAESVESFYASAITFRTNLPVVVKPDQAAPPPPPKPPPWPTALSLVAQSVAELAR